MKKTVILMIMLFAVIASAISAEVKLYDKEGRPYLFEKGYKEADAIQVNTYTYVGEKFMEAVENVEEIFNLEYGSPVEDGYEGTSILAAWSYMHKKSGSVITVVILEGKNFSRQLVVVVPIEVKNI